MPGRISQDALENVFSQIRSKGVTHPRPTKFRIALKLVCLSQLLYVNPGTNYEVDETPHLIDFIKNTISENKNTNESPSQFQSNVTPIVLDEAVKFLHNKCEMNYFYYVCVWSAKKVLKKYSCVQSTNALVNSNSCLSSFCNCAILTLVKLYVKNPLSYNFNDTSTYLCHLSSTVLNFLKHVEIAFRANMINAVNTTDPTVYIKRRILVSFLPPPNCHPDVFVKVVDTYLKLRFFIHERNCLRRVAGGRELASKSTVTSDSCIIM